MLLFGAVIGVSGDADTWLDVHAVPVQAQGLDQDLTDFLDHDVGIARSANAVQQHHELIAADACHGVGFPHTALEPVGHRLQQHVADRVTMSVIDVLEAVEVDVQQRHAPAVLPGHLQ
ncbi:hypothetical protein D3C72_1475740 [compost metagenome]